MGFFTGLIKGIKGGPEAARYNSKESYDQGYNHAKSVGADEESCVQSGLTHAIMIRNKARGRSTDQNICTMESTPFAFLAQTKGVAALLNYIVWLDYPDDVDRDELSQQITQGLCSAVEGMPEEFISGVRLQNFRWTPLLDSTFTWTKD